MPPRCVARPTSCGRRGSTAASASAPTPRSAATRRRGSSAPGLRPAGRRLGLRAGARPRQRLGDRVHGLLAARPGPRDGLRADRGRPPRHRSPAGRRVHGDTATGPFGLDTYGSRTLAVGGEAMAQAAKKVADKAKAIVAHQLEADPADIELRDGKWIVRGSPEKGMALADVAGAAYVPENLPEGMEPGSTRRRSTTPRTPSSRSGRTRAWSTSTARPARSRSSATSRSTTAGRRSTRCSSTGRSTAASRTASARPVRADPLRRGRSARDRLVRGLRAADRGGAAELRDGPHGDASPVNSRASRASERRARSPGRLR